LGRNILTLTSKSQGRRICPGLHVADASLIIAMSRILWAFDVKPDPTEDNRVMPMDDIKTIGAIPKPAPFKCRITIRNPETAAIVKESARSFLASSGMEDGDKYEQLFQKEFVKSRGKEF